MPTSSDNVGDNPSAADHRPAGPAASETSPQRLGSGSFASVYMIRGGTVAFKEVHQSHGEETALLQEYTTLERLYSTCDSDSFFMLPRPYAYCDPKDPSPSRVSRVRAAGRDGPIVGTASFRPFTKPTYAMQRVHSLPLPLAKIISNMYFPKEQQQQHISPTICRLYFGKVLPQRPGRFFNSANFPLDAARYSAICQEYTDEEREFIGLPPVEAVAEAMGEMLGRLHVWGGCDARDVEFVLGGDGGDGASFLVIDFNQVRDPQSFLRRA